MTIRVPRWVLLGLGAVAALAAIALGAWFFAIRDTGPSEAELREQRLARERAQARRLAQECRSQAGALIAAVEDLEGRLQGLGLAYSDYSTEVGDASSAYQGLAIGQLKFKCLSNVGLPLERALNSYVEAGNVWGECIEDFGCDTDSIDPELQDHWADASTAARNARSGLAEMFDAAN